VLPAFVLISSATPHTIFQLGLEETYNFIGIKSKGRTELVLGVCVSGPASSQMKKNNNKRMLFGRQAH